MKTDSELEGLLRATLNARAGELTEGAVLHATIGPVRPPRRWPTVLAAAAVVLAVAVGVTIGLHLRGTTTHSRPHHTPSPPADSITPVQCTTATPQSWQTALAAGTVSVHGQTLKVLATTASGDVLADEAAAVPAPFTHKLVLVTGQGSIRTVYGLAPPSSWHGMRIGPVSTEGDWVAFALDVQAVSGGQGPVQIDLANLKTGETRVVRPTTPTDETIVFGPVLANGAVYWTQIRAPEGLSYGPLIRYDISTGRRGVLDAHASSAPLLVDGLIAWKSGNDVRSERPGVITPHGFDIKAAIDSDSPLFTDPDTGVWQDPVDMTSILAAGSTPITVVPGRLGGHLGGLTGYIVWWSGAGGVHAADLRSGAAVVLPGTDRGHGFVTAAGNTAGIQVANNRVAVMDATHLPPLTC
jgi:hypothetical protein